MIEIALCLAIIGFALVSILLVLPLGMNTQRDTRQETIIGQDASVLLEAIRNGARGSDDLTNYVIAITNYTSTYINGLLKTGPNQSHVYGYTYSVASIDSILHNERAITNGLRIVGLLSTPEYTTSGTPPQALDNTFSGTYTSNHVVAYIRSVSGLAAEKPPQNNPIMQGNTFAYRLLCVNAPMPLDTNTFNPNLRTYSAYNNQLAANLRELRLLFLWPQLPSGNVGMFRQSFRASVGGQLIVTNDLPTAALSRAMWLYFYQPQSYSTNAP